MYLLETASGSGKHYVGVTEDLRARLEKHNAGQVASTAKHRPWLIHTAVAFRDRARAAAFEQYLKSHSGRAFAKKHL